MIMKGRQAAVFACGIALGAVAAAWFVMGQGDEPSPSRSASSGTPAAKAAPSPPSAKTAVAAVAESTRCEFEPVIAPAGDDGTQRMPSDLTGRTLAQVPPLLVTGKESAASGRPRDAEVAFLAACRAARDIGAEGKAVYADAKYHLGRHYASIARGEEASPAERAELLQRARLLYTDALAALRAQHGDTHERTRFAAQGLAAVEQSVAGAGAAAEPSPAASAAKPAKALAAASAPVPKSAATLPAPSIVRAPPEPAAKAKPEAPRRTVAVATPAPARSTPAAAASPPPAVPRPQARREPERAISAAPAAPVPPVAPVVAPPITAARSAVPRSVTPPTSEPRVAIEPAVPMPRRAEPQRPAPLVIEPPGAATGSADGSQ